MAKDTPESPGFPGLLTLRSAAQSWRGAGCDVYADGGRHL